MKNNAPILLCVSFAKDSYFNYDNNSFYTKTGGPGFFISKVLKNQKVNFKIISGDVINVDIKISNCTEYGKIKKPANPVKINLSGLKNDLIVSTVLADFQFCNIDNFFGRIFLDAQGFVRNGKKFGGKIFWKKNELYNNIFCLKVNDEELKYLPRDLIDKQKKKVLLITRGSSGSEIYYFGKKEYIKPKKIVCSPDTVGAGDTFFANFIVRFLKSYNTKQCLDYATKKTIIFLENKQ